MSTYQAEDRITDHKRIEISSHLLDCAEGKRDLVFGERTDAERRTYTARAAALLDEIESKNPIVLHWKAEQVARLAKVATELGMIQREPPRPMGAPCQRRQRLVCMRKVLDFLLQRHA